MTYHLEAWAMGNVQGKQRAVKAVIMLDAPPTEKDIKSATADATAIWRRWFVVGKRLETISSKTGMPESYIWPETTGHKVVER